MSDCSRIKTKSARHSTVMRKRNPVGDVRRWIFGLWASVSFMFLANVVASDREDDQSASSFATRTKEEWRSNWHVECHRKCRHELLPHIMLACDNDIYRLPKRNPVGPPLGIFLAPRSAFAFFRPGTTGRKKRNIMEECCYSKPCSWEEYAETCHSYGRQRAAQQGQCQRK